MTVNISIDIQDETTLDEIENIIGNALNEAGVDCAFEVDED